MGFYWENHKKKFDGKRLAWFGDKPNEDFWSVYWRKKISKIYYENLKSVKLNESPIGKILSTELDIGNRVIEAGCGSGTWVAILSNHGYDVLGIDFSKDLIEYVHLINPAINVNLGDALDIKSEDNYFDAYLSFGVIEHRLGGPEPFLKEASRVVKPGGKIILTVPCVGSLRLLKAKLGMYEDNIEDKIFFQYGFQKSEIISLLDRYNFLVTKYLYIDLDRLWIEEVKIYRKFAGYNRLRNFQKFLANLLKGIDGHMILLVGEKLT